MKVGCMALINSPSSEIVPNTLSYMLSESYLLFNEHVLNPTFDLLGIVKSEIEMYRYIELDSLQFFSFASY